MSRPGAKPRAESAGVTRSMRWSPAEWAAVERQAAVRGVSPSEHLRQLVAEHEQRQARRRRASAARASTEG